jgi:hypothetical protein
LISLILDTLNIIGRGSIGLLELKAASNLNTGDVAEERPELGLEGIDTPLGIVLVGEVEIASNLNGCEGEVLAEVVAAADVVEVVSVVDVVEVVNVVLVEGAKGVANSFGRSFERERDFDF